MDTGESKAARVGIYARISEDRSGDAQGVDRQIELAREVIGRVFGPDATITVYADNSISALRGKYRPQYEALCEAIRRGEIDAVVCYHQSRLWRNRVERAKGIELLQQHRVSLTPYRGAQYDMTTSQGRMMAATIGEHDTMESELKSERVRDQKNELARSGRFVGNGHRLFGYAYTYDRPAISPDTDRPQKRAIVDVQPHPDEAPIVKEAARRLLAGEPLRSITSDLCDRGVTTTTGRPMRTEVLRRVLASATISGRREVIPRETHTGKARPLMGKIVRDEGKWEALISPEDSDRIRAMLSRPERTTNAPTARKTLLTGILRCGLCGYPMVSRPRSNGTGRYVCNKMPGRPGCGGTHLRRDMTDETIRDAIIALLDEDGAALLARKRQDAEVDPDLIKRVEKDETALERLSQDRYDPDLEMTNDEYRRRRKEITLRLKANREALDKAHRVVGTDALEEALRVGVRAWWDERTDAQRRPLVTTVLDAVTVSKPTGRVPRNRFDPFRFEYHWAV